MGPEALALVVAGLVAGATGSWSPCGFSMVDTLGPGGHGGGRRTTAAACAAFALGAPVGGVLTFGSLAVAGALVQGGGTALGLAAALALAGAALDGLGVRVVPQVRRQVPERWRRVLPLPLAAGLYGVLLGLGFTTFVLAFAVPALAAVSVALADPGLGVLLGVAFGVGRTLPVLALAPLTGSERGARALELMASRPALLRGARLADAAALGLCAAVFVAPGAQAAVTQAASGARDPSAAPDGALAWQAVAGPGRVARPGADAADLPGFRPALGGGRLAYVVGDGVVVEGPGAARVLVPAAGADALAVSDRFLAWRAGRRLVVLDLATPGAAPRTAVTAGRGTTLGRPALAGTLLVWALASRRSSTISALDLVAGGRRVLRRERRGLIGQPAAHGGALAYVRATRVRQELRLGPLAPRAVARDRLLLRLSTATRRDPGHEHGRTTQGRLPEDRPSRRASRFRLWTTALTPAAAFVTRLRVDGRGADVVRVDR